MNMQIGVVFPQTEIGADRGAIRAYAERVEELGFSHLLAYDHVLGADPEVHTPWQGPYDVDTTFHEPFVLFGYLAAITALELVTGIIILPQRQTALVAKQAAEVDLLDRRSVPARRRSRLERGGVRSARHQLLRPRPADGRAGRVDARAVDAALGHATTARTST